MSSLLELIPAAISDYTPVVYFAVLLCCIFLSLKGARPSRLAGIAYALASAALWAVPFYRAISFYRRAHDGDYGADDGISYDADDAYFSAAVIFDYILCLAGSFTLALAIWRRPCRAFILPGGLLILGPLHVLWAHPEEAVVIVPSPAPFLTVIASGTALTITAVILLLSRRKNAGENRESDLAPG